MGMDRAGGAGPGALQSPHGNRNSRSHNPGSLGMPCLCKVLVHPDPSTTPLPAPQGYQWLKDKILSEEGRRQQAKLKELQAIAERLGCTLPQLAIGKGMGDS